MVDCTKESNQTSWLETVNKSIIRLKHYWHCSTFFLKSWMLFYTVEWKWLNYSIYNRKVKSKRIIIQILYWLMSNTEKIVNNTPKITTLAIIWHYLTLINIIWHYLTFGQVLILLSKWISWPDWTQLGAQILKECQFFYRI